MRNSVHKIKNWHTPEATTFCSTATVLPAGISTLHKYQPRNIINNGIHRIGSREKSYIDSDPQGDRLIHQGGLPRSRVDQVRVVAFRPDGPPNSVHKLRNSFLPPKKCYPELNCKFIMQIGHTMLPPKHIQYLVQIPRFVILAPVNAPLFSILLSQYRYLNGR